MEAAAWSMASHLRTGLVLEALDMALERRRPRGVVHHSDHGCQYTSLAFGHRCDLMGMRPSLGSVGDAYDNAMAETIIGLYKTEVIHKAGPWKGLGDVEHATLEWVWWFSHHRLLSSIGHVPPVEYEENFHSHHTPHERAVALT